MGPQDLARVLDAHRLAVIASRSPSGDVQAALIGIARCGPAEVVFDTLTTSRKYANVVAAPQVALVVGWDGEDTLQCEGIADTPAGDDRERCRAAYLERFPDGVDRAADPHIAYVRVRLTWARHSDFGQLPARIEEWRAG